MKLGNLAACALLVGLGAGCNTAAGNYFANRARDFGECFCMHGGLGFGLGAGVKAGGIANLGLGYGITFPNAQAGWAYGWPMPSDKGTNVHAPHVEAWQLLIHERRDAFRSKLANGFESQAAIVPAALTWVYGTYLWRRGWFTDHRYERVHAFDVEAAAFAGVLYARVGFSPGEFVDFLAGWFGLDLAGDDWEWKPPPEPTVPARATRLSSRESDRCRDPLKTPRQRRP